MIQKHTHTHTHTHTRTHTHAHTHVAATGMIRFVFGYIVIREFLPDLEQKSCGDGNM